jgi:hypothetical protein
MIPKLLVAGAAVMSVAFAEAAEGPILEDKRFSLACTGLLMTAGQKPPGSRIVADGMVDLRRMRVLGLGIGSATVVSATAAEVRFGSSAVRETVGAHTIEGTIDRISGETRVVVRSAGASGAVVIAMDLDCQPTPQAGH